MPSAKEWQDCVDAVWFVRFYQQRLWLRWSESAGWVLGVRCQVWIRPVCVIIEGCIVRRCVVYEVISFFSTRVSTVRCRLLSPLLTPLFGWAPWRRPSLSFPLCTLLTLAAVSLPQCDKTRLNRTHTCALWCIEVLNQHTLHSRIQKSKTPRGICHSASLFHLYGD